MNRDIHAEYWDEALGYAMDSADAFSLYEALTDDQRKRISRDLATSAENQGLAFGHEAIPNPEDAEIARLKRKHADEMASESRRFDVLLTEACRIARIDKDRVSVSESELLVHRN